jgi:NAD+ diphosphatase
VTAVNTFAGAHIDRAGPRRQDQAWVAARLADPTSRALVLTRHGVYLVGEAVPAPGRLADAPRDLRSWDAEPGGPLRPARIALSDATALPGSAPPVLLGLEAGTALFAVDADGVQRELADDALGRAGAGLAGLRDAAARLSADAAGLVAYATGMLNWHRRHGFCANCGAPTEPAEAGYVRNCARCGAHHYPRTDPVVIMLVVDEADDRLVLGRQHGWPPGRYSALAGFVEPGEPLEAAVAREVAEEAGVTVSGVRYVSSQPWPFPQSLMLGFVAAWAGGEPHAADSELDDARWFTRDEIVAAIAGNGADGLHLPPPWRSPGGSSTAGSAPRDPGSSRPARRAPRRRPA